MKIGVVENEPIQRNWLKKELGRHGEVHAFQSIDLLPIHNLSIIVLAITHLNLTYTLQTVSNLLNQGKKVIVLSTLPDKPFNTALFTNLYWIEKPYGQHGLNSVLLKIKTQLPNQ